jgi:hypothetical protein
MQLDNKVKHLMRLSKQSRWIVLFASAPLVCVMLYLALWQVPEEAPPPRYVSVVLAGYTNDALGRAVPMFSLSNMSKFGIQCSHIGPQVQVTNSVRGQGTNLWGWASGWTSCFLKPGEVCLVTVQPPTNAGAWRFGVFAIKPLSLVETGIEKLEPRLPARIYSSLRGGRRRTQLIQSGVIDRKESTRVNE